MKKQNFILLSGIILLIVAIVLIIFYGTTDGILRSLAQTLFGASFGLIGFGIVVLFQTKKLNDNPEKAKELEIEQKDERNVRIREKAGLTAWGFGVVISGVLAITLQVLGYTTAQYLAGAVTLINLFLFFILVRVYSKKM